MKKQKVVKMRQKRHIFFGVIIFLMVLTYLTYHAVSFLTREKPTVYTIGEQTSLAQTRTYTGLIIRQERVVKTEKPGIINYYVPASGRVSVNEMVYSVDETGNFTKIAAQEGIQNVKNTDVSGFLNEYSADYSGMQFSSVYDLKYELNSRLLLSASASELERFARDFVTGFEMHKAEATGLVEYYIDGFEELNEAGISAEDFDRTKYEKKHLSAMTEAQAGDPVYELITTEACDIYIPLSKSDAASMTETLNELKVVYEASHPGVTILYNFDSSGTLKTQIEEGATCDLFISAGQKQMNQLDINASPEVNTDGLDFVQEGTRVNLLENKVVLVVPANNPKGIESFDQLAELLEKGEVLMAMGGADVPVGQYTQKILAWYGLDEAALSASGCISYGGNVKQVTTQVEEGSVDCGVVYCTDAYSAGLTVVDSATAEMCGQVIYPAAVMKNAPHPAEALEFLNFLLSEEAMAVFETVGFSPVA